MRVLWFTNSPCNYQGEITKNGYNGGGWMTSLQNEIMKQKDIILGISFCMNNQPTKVKQNGVSYYPVPHHTKSIKDKILDFLLYKDSSRDQVLWSYYIKLFKQVIEDFKPDVIEVFGSELYISLAAIAADDYPCTLHIQGLLSLYIHIYLPPGVSYWQYCWKDKNIKKAYNNFQTLIYWKRSCYREKAILKTIPHIIGRTSWDKKALSLLNPNAQYHYGGEILRPEFYEPSERQMPSRLIITTTISLPLYKGYDLLLKTANILKNELHLDFEWNVFGNISPAFTERHEGLFHEELNIKLRGVASAKQLRESLLNSTLYFHPAYIENSPNSICEAQILGLPVVATNVGGTPSIIEDGVTGYLFPATDPYMAAYNIAQISLNKQLNQQISIAAKKVAMKRHNKEQIVFDLIDTYKIIIKKSNDKPHTKIHN